MVPDAASLREVLARFQGALPHVATGQIVTTILPLIALLVAMHARLAFGWWPLLARGAPAAALTVQTFIIQYDCGHGFFFRAGRANDLLGPLCSLLTLTPAWQLASPAATPVAVVFRVVTPPLGAVGDRKKTVKHPSLPRTPAGHRYIPSLPSGAVGAHFLTWDIRGFSTRFGEGAEVGRFDRSSVTPDQRYVCKAACLGLMLPPHGMRARRRPV